MTTNSIKYKIYIIFHKDLYAEIYKDIPEDRIKNHITFYAVNGKIPKQFDAKLTPYILFEKDLPMYDPFLQYNRFCESSLFHHLYKNWNLLVEPYEFIGSLQYDMIVSNKTFECIETKIQSSSNPANLFFYHLLSNSCQHLGNYIPDEEGNNECLGFDGWQKIIDIYNFYFKTLHTLNDVCENDIPLFHTFTLHKTVFAKIMTFIVKVTPIIFELLHYEVRHLPFHLERLMGIVCYFQKVEGIMTEWIFLPDVIHEKDIKDKEWDIKMQQR